MHKTARPCVPRRHFLIGAAVGAAFGAMPGRSRAQEERKLNVYNWDTYIGGTTLSTFTGETGIEVQYDLYAHNEELLSKLKEGNPGYDVIFPSDFMVQAMISLGIVQPLDHDKLSSIGNIDPAFANPAYDPGMAHSVPYLWGTVGIGYRKSKVETPMSWGDVLDSDKYAGRIALISDQRTVIGIALKYLGHSLNSTDDAEINQAKDIVIKQKKNLKAFAPDDGQNMLAAGDVDIVMEYNGDILQIMLEDDDVGYVVPSEGTNLWVDNMCIPRNAPHPENAHRFINHILDAEVNAEIATAIQYATADAAARQFIPERDLSNPAIYPPPEAIARSEQLLDVGDAAVLYDRAWTEIQAA